MKTILIEQLNADGSVFRIFTHRVHASEVASYMKVIERGYNMAHTRVTVS